MCIVCMDWLCLGGASAFATGTGITTIARITTCALSSCYTGAAGALAAIWTLAGGTTVTITWRLTKHSIIMQ